MQNLSRLALSENVEDILTELADEPHPRLTKRELQVLKTRRKALPLPSRVPSEFYDESFAGFIRGELRDHELDAWKYPIDSLEFWVCVRVHAAACHRRKHRPECYCNAQLDRLEETLDYRPATKTVYGARPLSVQDAYLGEVWQLVLNLLLPRRACGAACGMLAVRAGQFCAQHSVSFQRVSTIQFVDDAKERTRLAFEQLGALVPVAIETIADVMINGDRDADRLRAAETVLDRGGVPKSASLDMSISVPDDEIDRMLQRIQMATAAKTLQEINNPVIDVFEVVDEERDPTEIGD